MTVLFALIATTVIGFLARRPPEPTYQGRRLSEWLQQYTPTFGFSHYPAVLQVEAPYQAEAQEAIRAIGTNALPCLLKWINYEPHPRFIKLPANAPQCLIQGVELISNNSAKELRTFQAAAGIEALGTSACGAIPDLATIATNFSRPFAAFTASSALSYLGAEALPALWLIRSSCPPQQRSIIAEEIAVNIEDTAVGTHSLPYLLRAVLDDNPMVRQAATNALMRFAPEDIQGAANAAR